MSRRRSRSHDPNAEETTEAIIEGDLPFRRGTALAALRNRDFRIFWGGTFASNIGTWMQNVLLGAYGYELTGSATFVGILFFAQLGPLLFMSNVGGVLADVVDRRKLLIITQLAQLILSAVLAGLAVTDNPSLVALVLCVFAIGVANALSAPAIAAILPTLVPRADLPGAVSLQSVQMNLSRVIGPAIGALIYSRTSAAPVFALNAATYLFAVAGVVLARYRHYAPGEVEETGLARLLSGFRLAWRDPLIRRILTILVVFSFFSLSFVGLMPVVAAENFGIRPRSIQYGLLYAAFGLGAATGAISVGTLLAGRSKAIIPRVGLIAFAVLLTVFALLRAPGPAYPLAFVLGFAYFLVITSLATVLQENLDDAIRGRIMALWIMGFGGVVPLGVLAGGFVATHANVTLVLVFGAAAALLLAPYAKLEPGRAGMRGSDVRVE
ncbi:MAG: MFS transporter [Actinomycetota bacterium]|jgi:MFS family permease|nr:MFS transporter [Actinomycetota bacterium]